jgi:hypothetical protein
MRTDIATYLETRRTAAAALKIASAPQSMQPRNRLIHGDCVQELARLDPTSIDFALTDPPYVVDYRSRDGRSVANDDNADWLRPAFAEIYRVLKPASFCVRTCHQRDRHPPAQQDAIRVPQGEPINRPVGIAMQPLRLNRQRSRQ